MKRVTVLGVLLVAQVAVMLVLGKRGGHASRVPSPYPKVRASEITKVAITKDKKTVTLVKDAKAAGTQAVTELSVAGDKKKADKPDPWRLETPDYPADAHAVKSLVEAIEKASFGEKVSAKKEWHGEKFGVDDEKATKIEVFSGDAQLRVALFLGKEAGGRVFARLVGSDDVFAMSGLASHLYNKAARDWRDKTILAFRDQKEDLVKVTIAHASGETIQLARKDPKTWEMVEPKLPKYRLDQKVVEGVVDTLVTYNAADFADDAKESETGLSKAALSVQLEWKPGSRMEKSATLLVGKKHEKDARTYAQLLGDKQVFLVNDYQVTQLKKSVEELREKDPIIPKFATNDVSGITIRQRGVVLELAKEANGSWALVAPVKDAADSEKIKTLLDKVSRETVAFNEKGGREKHGEFEVDGRGLFVQMATADRKLEGFLLGKEEGGATYIRRADDEKVYQTFALKKDDFPVDAKAWRNRTVMSFSGTKATRLEVEREGGSWSVERKDGKWTFMKGAPIGTAVKVAKIEEAISVLSGLRAIEVAGGGEPGADKVVATVRVVVGGKAMAIKVGGKKGTTDTFVKREGGEATYVVRSSQVEKFFLKVSDVSDAPVAPAPARKTNGPAKPAAR